MHTFLAGNGTRFNFNGDFSGKVYVVRHTIDGVQVDMEVPAQDLLEFVAEYLRSKKISKIESATVEELLFNKV